MKNSRNLINFNLHKRIQQSVLILLLFSIYSCGSRQPVVQSYQELSRLVEKQQFQIEQEWGLPLGGSMINMLSNINYIRFNGEEVNIFIPYFGVRHAGGNYGRAETGIVFEGKPENLNINEVPGKEINIHFDGTQGNENYQFRIVMYPNGDAHTYVNSSQRNSISYRGIVKPLPEGQR